MKYFKEIAQKKGATYGRGTIYEAKPGDVTCIVVTKNKTTRSEVYHGYKVLRVYPVMDHSECIVTVSYIYPDQDTDDSYWRFVEISEQEAFALML